MSLTKYHEKRKFEITPEPSGEIHKSQDRLHFVIQKHKASHLHYDLRLEAEGVLKSWAVPKGPSYDPSIKRLAMMTEDHPFDYKNFEGVIPKGNYGAGKVIVWDEGFYETIKEPQNSKAEVLKELKKGNVKVKLFGKKVNGVWALVKMNKEDNSWLLIKEKDEYSGKHDLTKMDKSVISGLRVEEVNDKQELLNTLRELPKSEPPYYVKPMLASLFDKPFDDDNFLFEIKWDGYRAIADTTKDEIRLYSRNQKDFSKSYQPIIDALKKIPYKAVFDGEIVVLDKNGKPDFQALQNYAKGGGNLVYYVFDLIFLEGRDLTTTPLLKRKEILNDILPKNNVLKLSTHIVKSGFEFFAAAQKQNIEGIIAKKCDSEYIIGYRSRNWLKIKTRLRQEAIICGFTKPREGRKHFGALILGVYKDGQLSYVGHTGSGFDEKSLKIISEKLNEIVTKKSPFEEKPTTNMPATWVKPQLVCEVEFSQWTKDGNMRHPIFKGIRNDKRAEDISIEKPVEKIYERKEKPRITNLKKVFWPDEGYTKGDLINYYKEISDIILPYLKDRPESLKRYPDGINGDYFFQKDTHNLKLPSFVKSIKIYSESEDKETNYLICNNNETLLYMVNLGCIDINPWSSRVDNLERPDYMIFDLDPEEISFEKVVDTANEIRKTLEDIDVESFPKTSGATGIHIIVPVGGNYTYQQVRTFAEVIVRIVNKKNPDFTSIIRSPAKRRGKVYLDFLQNRIGQTIAAPYSVRPRPEAPVSTPLLWKEVNKYLKPNDFTINNTLKRIEKHGDIWAKTKSYSTDIIKSIQNLETRFNTGYP